MQVEETIKFLSGASWKNRFALAPMTNHQSGENGEVTPEEVKWLSMRSDGGFGMVMTCAAHVSPEGQGFPRQLGVYDDKLSSGLCELSHALDNTFSAVQLHHAGIRSPRDLINQQPLGPSDHEETGSRAMSLDEVHRVINDFISAAKRVQVAGFNGVEIHGAHGYLLAQFMSKELNHRDDRYGGSYLNRTRIVREIIDGIKSACDNTFGVGLRLSAEGNGMPLSEVTRFAQELMSEGQIDYLDMSLWDCFKEPEEVKYRGRSLMSYFTELNRGEVKLGVAGKIRTPGDVRAMIENGADFVLLGKSAIIHHDFPNRYMENSSFEAMQEPVSEAHLSNEGLSENFIKYMKAWDGFVKTPGNH